MLKGLFDGYAAHRRQHAKQSDFDHLTETGYLYSSDYLKDLYARSSSPDQAHILLDYMDHFDVDDEQYEGYHSLCTEIMMDMGYMKMPIFTPEQQVFIKQYIRRELSK